MKKLIAILSSLGMTASMSTVVVACGNSNSVHRFSIPTLSEKIRDQILVSLSNDKSLSDITNGKRFNDINVQDVILKMVQDKISKLSNEYFKNNLINKRLQLNVLDNYYQDQIDETASDIAQNQFYLEYTKRILTNPATPLDIEISIGDGGKNLYNLNPQTLLGNDKEIDGANQYFVFMHEANADGTPTNNDIWYRWQFAGEYSNKWVNHLPTIKELQNNKFVILKKTARTDIDNITWLTEAELNTESNLFYKKSSNEIIDDDNRDIYSLDGSKGWTIDGKTALEYRFQEYFIIKYKSQYFNNLLTMTYLDSNLFNISRNENETFSNQDAFLNISSNVAQTLQTWNLGAGYTSKIKMVWSFTFDTDEQVKKAWELIGGNDKLNYDGSLMDASHATLRNFYNLLEADSIIKKNSSNMGTDPFFGFNGYNGIVENDGDDSIKSVDGNLILPDDSSINASIAHAKGPSILTSNGAGFKSKNQKNKFEYIFVLPIYLIDLLNDRTEGFDYGQSTTAFALKENIGNDNKPNLLYTSYGEATSGNKKIKDKKLAYIVNNLNQATNYYIYANNGVPYTIDEIKIILSDSEINEENIWEKIKNANEPDDFKIEGIQFMTKNSNGTTFGNIGIRPLKDGETEDNATNDASQWIKLGPNLTKPNNIPGQILFDEKDGNLYVRAINESLVNTVQDFSPEANFKLSFDDAIKDGLYTINGTRDSGENQNRTYSYKVNMGPSASNATGYINNNNGFDYYQSNISSLDISNLSSAKKTTLLREIEFITSNEPGVADTAASNIYPLFLTGDQILFEPLYNSLKKYLIEEDGGSSD